MDALSDACSRLTEALEQLPPLASAQLFGERTSEAFLRILRSPALVDYVFDRVALLEQDPAAYTGRYPGRLLSSPWGDLRLTAVAPLAPGLGISGESQHQWIGAVGGEVLVRRYRHEQPCDDPSILRRECRLSDALQETLHAGSALLAEAWRDVIEPASVGVLLVLRSAPVHQVRWGYDRMTRHPTRLVAASPELGRIEDALEVLRHIGREEDVEDVLPLTRHECHAVRWAAVRTAHTLGYAGIEVLLHECLGDPHVEVREAARQALQSVANDRRV
jgi:hypothetical protein